jgi:hypothetical protein
MKFPALIIHKYSIAIDPLHASHVMCWTPAVTRSAAAGPNKPRGRLRRTQLRNIREERRKTSYLQSLSTHRPYQVHICTMYFSLFYCSRGSRAPKTLTNVQNYTFKNERPRGFKNCSSHSSNLNSLLGGFARYK